MADPNLANQNAPTVGALAAAFWASLVGWGAEVVDAPGEVEATGAAFLIGLGAFAIGRAVQRFHTDPKGTS